MYKLVALRLMLGLTLCLAEHAGATGIPTFDGANVTQSVISAVEEVAQTLKQIEQYTTQLNQYATQLQQLENQVLNTTGLAEANRVMISAQSSIKALNELNNTLQQQQQALGNLDSILSMFKDMEGQASACLNGAITCNSNGYENYQNVQRNKTKAVKSANDAVLRGADQQFRTMETDAIRLENLQNSVRSAQGQVQVAQANGQLQAEQINQLLQMRSALIAQATAAAMRDQAANDELSRQAAASAALRSGSFSHGGAKKW